MIVDVVFAVYDIVTSSQDNTAARRQKAMSRAVKTAARMTELCRCGHVKCCNLNKKDMAREYKNLHTI